ncbi:MAG: hypothetical protein R6W85_11485 [Gillisia sp.]
MSNFRICLAGIAVFVMLFTSCSKEDGNLLQDQKAEKATLSFGAILNDLANTRSSSKQSLDDLPEWSDEDPFYVMIILSQDGSNVVGSVEAPFRVNLASNQIFTVEAPELELDPGEYSLDYFAVYSEAGELIWLAPSGGIFEEYFDNPMPMLIDLNAGVKKYIEVSVLCFDDRFVNEYGYLFFDLVTTQAIEFCVFGNYCDETGRHYPAEFSVSVWNYSNGAQGALLHSNLSNTVELNDDGDYAGTTVCMALPDTAGLNEYYFEITIRNSDAYGAVTEEVIRSGVISDDDVRALFDGDDNTDYFHFRHGACNLDDSPNLFQEGGGNGGEPGECNPNDPNADCDNDGVRNELDQCPGTPPGTDVDEVGCEAITVPGRDVVVFNDINIFDNDAMADLDNVRLVQNLVTYTTSGSRNNGDVVMMDRGRDARCFSNTECNNNGWSTMRDVITDEGYTISDVFSTAGSLTNIPSNVKVVFLVMPTQVYTVEEINTFKSFAAQGGRIIIMGEHSFFYLHIDVQNQFLLNMGAVLHNTGGALDCNYTTIPNTSNRVHPIMEGIDELTIACASVIEPGPNDFPLFYDTTNTHVLAGVAKIDSTPISELKSQIDSKRGQSPTEEIPNPSSSTGF